MLKRSVSILILLLALVLAIGGCGDSEGSSGEGANQAAVDAVEAEVAAAREESEAPKPSHPKPRKIENGFDCGEGLVIVAREAAYVRHANCEFARYMKLDYENQVGSGAGHTNSIHPDTDRTYSTNCVEKPKVYICLGLATAAEDPESTYVTVRFPND